MKRVIKLMECSNTSNHLAHHDLFKLFEWYCYSNICENSLQ